MNDIDKWCAEQCGVNLSGMVEGMVIGDEKPSEFVTLGSQWTIQDPRCREIVRERFRVCTDLLENDRSDTQVQSYQSEGMGSGQGKTIAEAEIACITAIYQQLCLDEMTEIAQKTGQYDD